MKPGVILIAALAVVGCAKLRPLAEEERRLTVWREDIAPMVERSCASCHSGENPSGGYDTTSYFGLLGGGSDQTPNAIAGDPNSVLLRKLTANNPDQHPSFEALLPTLEDWVVRSRLAYFRSLTHEGGLMNPADSDFHGSLVESLGWDFDNCASCHGEDFSGGAAKVSCKSCHPQGPTACDTCHGLPPQNGAHKAHTSAGALGKTFDCAECHQVPTRYDDPGHILLASGVLDPSPAEVRFGAFASIGLPPGQSPTFQGEEKSCQNVYCHGGTFNDGSAQNPAPSWLSQSSVTCASCHGAPPSDHANSQCELCHAQVAGPNQSLLSTALHLNGELQLGDGSDTCSACHGGSDNAAPPRDLLGQADRTLISVGSHQSHLKSTHRLTKPLECSACHEVPEAVSSVGHIDSALPAEVVFSGLAQAGGDLPVWSREQASCSGTYCHGQATPVWTRFDLGEAACGTCHDLPPQDNNHTESMPPFSCATCHPQTVDAFGNIRITGGPGAESSFHINGVVDAQ